MKNKKMLEAMSLIDEKYVAEASPLSKKRSIGVKQICAMAACLCIMVTALWLFIPINHNIPSVSKYADSEYYSIIEKLNEVTFKAPLYKNNFEMLTDSLVMKDADGGAPESSAPSYQEVTDNQVEGIIEADRFKASSTHIFYIKDARLVIYSIDGLSSTEVGTIDIKPTVDDAFKYGYEDEYELYLSSDCTTVTVICPYGVMERQGGRFAIIRYDVTDPTAPAVKDQIAITGGYVSSRMVDNELILISNFNVVNNVDFSKESNFVPQYNDGQGFVSIKADKITSPEILSAARYTVVWRIGASGIEITDYSAFLSYSNSVYVSDNNVYVSREYAEAENENKIIKSERFTEIIGVKYSDGELKQIGGVTVKGYIKDQYSLDEYEGILRVATTTRTDISSLSDDGKYQYGFTSATNASLYCVDLSSWQVAAAVENFAPDGERVYSVRFDGANAYVCTALQKTDPVYFFDLSDISAITYVDTGTIPGFSTSLIQLGDGFLLGIGENSSPSGLKIEVYVQNGGAVESVAKVIYKNSYYSVEYKSYFIDRERGLIGFGMYTYTENGDAYRYVLLHFDGYKLTEIFSEEISGEIDLVRAMSVDGYMYILTSGGLKVKEI